MDLIDKLNELATRIKRQREHVMTEEATKTAFILPFIQALGYDVFNPSEVIPELTADHGVKKGEKVDYAIKQDNKITILFECKPIGADLEAKYAGQLFRYFAVTDARFGVLTDGIRYVFFSDLEKQNKMDERPFFEINLLHFSEDEVEQLKHFSKGSFDLETIVGAASNLKYHRALLGEIRKEYEEPSEELVRLLTSRVYAGGRITQQIKDQFSTLTKQALRDFVRDKVDSRLKSALHSEEAGKVEAATVEEEATPAEAETGIVTTEDERRAYRIIQAIGAEITDVGRIAIRDAKSYCSVLLDDNNRKPICRFYFMKTKMSVSVFTADGEKREDIERLEDIFKRRDEIQDAICRYDPSLKKPRATAASQGESFSVDPGPTAV